MQRKTAAIGLIAALVAGVGSYVTWAAIRASRNLVTLNVRDMEVRKVIGKLEWQTRETIVPDKNVKGRVTFNVRKVPLENVLQIIGDQTQSRFTTIYPLYSDSRSMSTLQRALRGELNPDFAGWTNLQSRGFGGGPMGGPGGPGGPGFGRGGLFFGEMRTNASDVVSLDIRGKDVQFAARALSRFGGARVVPHDKLHQTVNLTLDQVPVEAAVARLAKNARAKWDRLYALRGFDDPRQFAERREGFREMTDAEREEMRRQRQEAEEQLMQTISPEERAKLEEARKEREKFFRRWRASRPSNAVNAFSKWAAAPCASSAISNA